MTSIFHAIPLVLVEKIISECDAVSTFNFMATCKLGASLKHLGDNKLRTVTKNVLVSIVSNVKDFATVLENTNIAKELMITVLKEIWRDYAMIRCCNSSAKEAFVANISVMIGTVVHLTGLSFKQVNDAWVNIWAPNYKADLTQEQINIVHLAMTDYVFGERRCFSICFGTPSNDTNTRHMFSINLDFNDISPTMQFAMSDWTDISVNNNTYDDDKLPELLKCIPGSYSDNGGEIHFDITDENIGGMADALIKLSGNKIFTDNVEIALDVTVKKRLGAYTEDMPFQYFPGSNWVMSDFAKKHLKTIKTRDCWSW